MDKVGDLLLKLLEEKRASHFYIINASKGHQNPKEEISNFILDLISKYISKTLKISPERAQERLLMGHPDTLLIPLPQSEKESEQNYKTEELSPFFNFLQYGRIELPWRFIVIFNSHKLTPIILNKMLKSLEAPTKDTTIFFLNPTQKNFLPTIESRAIILTLSDKSLLRLNEIPSSELFKKSIESLNVSKTIKENLLNWHETDGQISDLIEIVKKSQELEPALIKVAMSLINRKKANAPMLDEFLKALKTHQQGRSVNLPLLTRSLKLLDSIKGSSK